MVCGLSGVDFLYRYAGTAGHTKTPSPVETGGNPVVPLCLTRRFPADVRSSATIRQGAAGRIPYNGGVRPSCTGSSPGSVSRSRVREQPAACRVSPTHGSLSRQPCLSVPGLCVSNSAIVTRNGSVVKSFLKNVRIRPPLSLIRGTAPQVGAPGRLPSLSAKQPKKKPDFFSYGSTVMLFSS